MVFFLSLDNLSPPMSLGGLWTPFPIFAARIVRGRGYRDGVMRTPAIKPTRRRPNHPERFASGGFVGGGAKWLSFLFSSILVL